MNPTREILYGYGLRDPRSGEFVRVELPEEGGDHVSLTLVDYGELTPRLSMSSLAELLAASKEDTPWYNSSKLRPKWGDVDVPSMIPVRFTRTLDFDGFGSEPVSTAITTEVVVVPELFPGEARPARSDAPGFIMAGVFGGDWRRHTAPGDGNPTVLLVDTVSGPLEAGSVVFDHYGVARQAAVVVPVPEDWPKAPFQTESIDAPTLRLVLASSEISHEVRPFLADDFAIGDPAPRM